MSESTSVPAADVEIRIDHERLRRTGLAEAVYAPGKSPAQCAEAVAQLLDGPGGGPVLLTRANAEQAMAARRTNPGAETGNTGSGPAMTLVWRRQKARGDAALLLAAGTGDVSVAREAAVVLEAYGIGVELVVDVGVAGLHRVLAHHDQIAAARVVLVFAGMEGALPSVVAGMTSAPVIAVPVSTGYGAGLEGVTALLAMHASCSPGITVVGIDNGFGAACAAIRLFNSLDRA
jgi:pyridinium-3,5-biscarboxylic acid mononucleotide synthase